MRSVAAAACVLLVCLLLAIDAKELVTNSPLVSYAARGATLHSIRGPALATPWLASTINVLGAQMVEGATSLALHTYNASDASDSISEYSARDGRLTRTVVQLHSSIVNVNQARQHFLLVERPPLATPQPSRAANASASAAPSKHHQPSPSNAPKPLLLVYSQAGRTLLAYDWLDGAYQGIAYRSAQPLRALMLLAPASNTTANLAWLSDTHVQLVHFQLDAEQSVWSFAVVASLPVPEPRLLIALSGGAVLGVVYEQSDGRYGVLRMRIDDGVQMIGSTQLPTSAYSVTLDESVAPEQWLLASRDGTLRRYYDWPVDRVELQTPVRSSLLVASTPMTWLLLSNDVQRVDNAATARVDDIEADSALWPLSMHGNALQAERTLVLDCRRQLAVQDRGSMLYFALDRDEQYEGHVSLALWPRLDVVDTFDTCQPSALNKRAAPLLLASNVTHAVELDAHTGELLSAHTLVLPCAMTARVFYCGERGIRRVCVVCAPDATLFVAQLTDAGYALQPFAQPTDLSAPLYAALYDEQRDAAVVLTYAAAGARELQVRRLALRPSRREWGAVETALLPGPLPATAAAADVDVDGSIVLRMNATHLVRENGGRARWRVIAGVATRQSLRITRRAYLTHGLERSPWNHALAAIVVLCCLLPLAALGAILLGRTAQARGWTHGLQRSIRLLAIHPRVQHGASRASATCPTLTDWLRRLYTLCCCCCPSLVHTLDGFTVGAMHQQLQEVAVNLSDEDFIYVDKANSVMGGASGSTTLHRRRRSAGGEGGSSNAQVFVMPQTSGIGVLAAGSQQSGSSAAIAAASASSSSLAPPAQATVIDISPRSGSAATREPFRSDTLESVHL